MIGDQTILDNNQGITRLRCVDYFDRVWSTSEYNFQSYGSNPNPPITSPSSTSWCEGQSGSTNILGSLTAAAIGPLMRLTTTLYHSFSGGPWILDEPDSVIITDYTQGSATMVRQTSYVYDAAALSPSTAINLVSAAGSTASCPYCGRGNPTSVSDWLNTTGANLTTNYLYYDTGQVQSMTDPRGYKTTYSYADNYAGGAGSPPGQTNAYLTNVTNPLGQTQLFSWGYSDGLLMSSTDPNNQTSNYQYSDPLLRLSEAQGPPLNGVIPTTTYRYADWTPSNTTPSSMTKSEFENASSNYITSVSTFDGLGRAITTELTTDPNGPDYVQTVYDGFGRVHSVSNPYRSTSDATYGVTTNSYDALGRKIKQSDSDGFNAQYWNYSGNSVAYTDENNHHWTRTSDALGRLAQVAEPGVLVTAYTYDALSNLLAVNQKGNGSTDAVRARTFAYDSLSRLYSATNPETGTISYTYDANGNVQSKTDARGFTTNYGYDALNRLLSKGYSDKATPFSCYQYDVSSVSGATSGAAGNMVGRLSNAWTLKGSGSGCSPSAAPTPPASPGFLTIKSVLLYDPMGRPTSAQQQQCIGSQCAAPSPYQLTMAYDLAGNMTALKNSVGASNQSLTLTNYFDGASRPCLTTSSWSGTAPLNFPLNLFQTNSDNSTPGYAAFGGLQAWYMGSSSSSANTSCGAPLSSPINVTQNYTNRLWVGDISATGQIP